jgi:hypothetical protein
MGTNRGEKGEWRDRASRRFWVAGSTGTLGAVMLLLILAPAGSAVAPHVVMSAPYTGSVLNSNAWSVSGCAKAKITSPAAFSLTSGMGGFAGKTSANTCKSSTFGNNRLGAGNVYGGSSVAIKIKVATSGAKTIVANWTFTATGAQNLSTTTCVVNSKATYSSCYQYASVYLAAYSYLVDLKTGSTWSSSTYFYEYNASYYSNYCYNGTCYTYSSGTSPGGFSGSMGALFSFSATLNSKHTYALFTSIYESVGVYLATYNAHFTGTASGTASLDMATGGNGAVLNSVTVT